MTNLRASSHEAKEQKNKQLASKKFFAFARSERVLTIFYRTCQRQIYIDQSFLVPHVLPISDQEKEINRRRGD